MVLADAAEALRFGQAQHAARNAAAALALAAKAVADHELAAALRAGLSTPAAARAADGVSFALWQGAVGAYRDAAAPSSDAKYSARAALDLAGAAGGTE